MQWSEDLRRKKDISWKVKNPNIKSSEKIKTGISNYKEQWILKTEKSLIEVIQTIK